MTPSDGGDIYRRTIQRVTRLMIGLGLAGALIAGIRLGWRTGAGFLIGAGLSYLSFWRWRKVTESIGASPPSRNLLPMLLRFGLLIAGAYVIIRVLGLNPASVFLGLLVAGAAVVLSLVLELIYAGK